MKAELKARVEEYYRQLRKGDDGYPQPVTNSERLINDLSTALQEARAESHDAMNRAQAMVGNLEQQLHDTEARLQVAVEALEVCKTNHECRGDYYDGWATQALAKIKEMEGSDA